MRILLTNCALPRSLFSEYPVFPLGMAVIAGVLRQHDVLCFDACAAEDPASDLARLVARFQPEVVGLSLRNMDTAQSYEVVSYWPAFVQTVRGLRGLCPGALFVAGGAGFSLFAQAIMQRVPELDLGVYLEGEESFPELLSNLGHPELVRGIFYRRDGGVLFSGSREPVCLDDLPMPRWELLDLSPYRGMLGMGVQTKRGCAFDCIYCSYPFLTGGTLRLRSPEKVGEEVETLRRQYGVKDLFFADNIFNCPQRHAEAICEELIRRGVDVRWTAYFEEAAIDAGFVRLAQQAGCFNFSFSPDGYNETGLRTLGKRTSLQQMRATYRLLNRIPGARFRCDFVWNYPHTGWRDLRSLFGMVLGLMRMRNVSGIAITTLRILPGTRLHQIAIEEGRVAADDPLLLPKFYDPMPWRLVSAPMNHAERLYRKARHKAGNLLRRLGRTRKMTGKGPH